jgi:signal transduction histidine kinase
VIGLVERATASRLVVAGIGIPLAASSIWLVAKAIRSGASEASAFMPHGVCYMWDPAVVWLHVISDALITLSYYCIPLALVYLIRRRSDLPFNWIFAMFGLFILGCGTTHLLEIWTVWHASYLLSGAVKAATAAISVVTAVMLIPLIPKAVALPSVEQLRAVNDELRRQIEGRDQDQMGTLAARGRTLVELADRKVAVKEAEEDLANKVEELARSNADLEQFAYVASHDLQEPLRMVTIYTQLLGERYRGKLDDNADKFIGYASEGAQRMQVLIQDLLAFSRVGRNGFTSGSVDCNAVMAEVLQTLAPAIQESSAGISYAELPSVWADRTQVTQVFQNLIQNAIKFRGKEAPLISVQAEKADQQWRFSVSDNGIGIAPEHAENIFVVFQRLHARTEYSGNGIGLAICKKIVEHYHGKIWVESQTGSGSSFKFTLPSRGPDGGKGE